VCRVDTRRAIAALPTTPESDSGPAASPPHPRSRQATWHNKYRLGSKRVSTRHTRIASSTYDAHGIRRTTVHARAQRQLADLASRSERRAIKPVCRVDTAIRGAQFDHPALEYGVSTRHTVHVANTPCRSEPSLRVGSHSTRVHSACSPPHASPQHLCVDSTHSPRLRHTMKTSPFNHPSKPLPRPISKLPQAPHPTCRLDTPQIASRKKKPACAGSQQHSNNLQFILSRALR
jgi:hypothetical protein